MVAVALGQVFRTAMNGTSESLPELAASALPLEITVAAVPARGRDTTGLVARLRDRDVGHKRSMALREYALGVEAVEGFVGDEPL